MRAPETVPLNSPSALHCLPPNYIALTWPPPRTTHFLFSFFLCILSTWYIDPLAPWKMLCYLKNLLSHWGAHFNFPCSFIIPLLGIMYREILCAPMSCHSFFFPLFLSYVLHVLANDEKAGYNNNSHNVHILNLSEMPTAGWPTICRRSRS